MLVLVLDDENEKYPRANCREGEPVESADHLVLVNDYSIGDAPLVGRGLLRHLESPGVELDGSVTVSAGNEAMVEVERMDVSRLGEFVKHVRRPATSSSWRRTCSSTAEIALHSGRWRARNFSESLKRIGARTKKRRARSESVIDRESWLLSPEGSKSGHPQESSERRRYLHSIRSVREQHDPTESLLNLRQ